MDKLNKVNASNIKAYLSYDNSNLDDGVVYQSLFFNVILLFIGIVFGVSSFLTWLIAIVLSILCIIFMISFKFKMPKTQKQINFCYAISMLFMSINLCYNSCIFFSQTTIGFFIPLLFYVVLLPLLACLMVSNEKKRIIDGFHKEKKFNNPVVTAIAVCGAGLGVLIFRLIYDKLNEKLVLAICCGVLGLIFAFFSRFFVKWYCYFLLERKKGKTGDG